MTDGFDRGAIILVPPIGMAMGIFEALSRALIERGRPIVSWELGDVGGDRATFYDHVSSYDEICGRIADALNALCRGPCSAVSLCNGASILAQIQRKALFEIDKSAIVGPYFHLANLDHNSIYEKTLMPLLAKAGEGSAAAAKMIHKILNSGQASISSRKDQVVKAHLVSPDSVLAYAQALVGYRQRDELDLIGELRGKVALFYCLDDEAVSHDYFLTIAEHLVEASRYIYRSGGHYAVFDDSELVADVVNFLIREEVYSG
ncbi:hypothetical protein [Rhizobium leguminosarum]|uniref:hypothetical protein n=1 Tax=Rhizobium leguminosarum TaxID=384 RepID=UPI001C922533|nr:hypothetical protein [Rhizobium leguminosarum]MBY2989332.1 hypothetical protein [Rhizobium leguminosarum]